MRFNLQKYYRRKKTDDEKILNAYIMNNGIAHIACQVDGRDDVISHFCLPGFEVLSDEFASFLEQSCDTMPSSVPILIEIIGGNLTEQDKHDIEDAVWNHFEINAAHAQKMKKSNFVQFSWFLVCLAVVCFWLWLIKDQTNNQVYLNLVFVLFYFFGDTVIRMPLVDNKACEESRIKFTQISCAKVIFSEKDYITNLSDEQAQAIADEVIQNTKCTDV